VRSSAGSITSDLVSNTLMSAIVLPERDNHKHCLLMVAIADGLDLLPARLELQ